MRIHSNLIRADKVRDALASEIAAGRIADHVTFKDLGERGSRSHYFAVEVQLEASQPDKGRRAGNSGSYGAMRPEIDGYAATYDEWGWLLSALYRIDPDMIVGGVKHPVYRDRADFNHRTGLTYDPWEWYAQVIEWPTFADGRDPYPWVTGRAASTKRGYLEGRRGADRLDVVTGSEQWRRGWPVVDRPRTVAEVLEFAHLTADDLATVNA